MKSIWNSVIPIYKVGSLKGKSKNKIQKMFDEVNSNKPKLVDRALTPKERFIANRNKRKK